MIAIIDNIIPNIFKDFFNKDNTPTKTSKKTTITKNTFMIPGRGNTPSTNQSKKLFPSSEILFITFIFYTLIIY